MRKKTLFILLVLIIGLSLVAYGVYSLRPAKVVEDALDNLAASTTHAFHAKIAVSNPQASLDLLGEQAAVELDIDGKFEREENRRDSLDAVVKLTTKTETVTLLVEANTRFIDEQAYFQITKAPLSIPILAQLKGQWIKLPRGTQKESGELPLDNKIFHGVDAIGSEEIAGDKTKVYQGEATSAAIIRMLDSIASILGTHLTGEQISNIQKGVVDTQTLPVKIAITPWSREVRQISSSTTVPNSNNTIDIEFTFTDRNQPVEITVPDNAQTLEEIAGTGSGANDQ